MASFDGEGGGGIRGDMGPDGATARAHSWREEIDVLLVELEVSAVENTWCSAGAFTTATAVEAPPLPREWLFRDARIPTILSILGTYWARTTMGSIKRLDLQTGQGTWQG